MNLISFFLMEQKYKSQIEYAVANLVSGEIVIGTGYFSNLEASFSDIFGVQSTEYSDKIKKAKTFALNDMIAESTEKGGNAIIGVSYDIITFNRDMIGVSVNGTSVIVEPEQ